MMRIRGIREEDDLIDQRQPLGSNRNAVRDPSPSQPLCSKGSLDTILLDLS
jgi:hypothetical protein